MGSIQELQIARLESLWPIIELHFYPVILGAANLRRSGTEEIQGLYISHPNEDSWLVQPVPISTYFNHMCTRSKCKKFWKGISNYVIVYAVLCSIISPVLQIQVQKLSSSNMYQIFYFDQMMLHGCYPSTGTI